MCIAAGMMVLLFTNGCKKYLDQQPITELGPEKVFTDVPNTLKALSGVYSRLVGDQGYGIRLSLYYPLDNDEMQGPTGNPIMTGATSPGTSRQQVMPSWKDLQPHYSRVSNTPISVLTISRRWPCTTTVPEMRKNNQAHVRRSLGAAGPVHFEAIRNWGDLPKHFQPAYAQAAGEPFQRKPIAIPCMGNCSAT